MKAGQGACAHERELREFARANRKMSEPISTLIICRSRLAEALAKEVTMHDRVQQCRGARRGEHLIDILLRDHSFCNLRS